MSRRLRRHGPVLVALVPLLVLPFLGGLPRFVDSSECAVAAVPGDTRQLAIVYGRFDSPVEAEELAERARSIGYAEASAEPDGCGRWKVANGAVDSYEGGMDAVAEGERAGLPGWLEVDQG